MQPFDRPALLIIGCKDTKFSGLRIRNYKGLHNSEFPIVGFSSRIFDSLELDNFVVENSDLSNQVLFLGGNIYQNFTLTKVVFSNVTVSSSAVIMRIIGFQDFKLEEVSFSQVRSLDPTDTSSVILSIDFVYFSTPTPIRFSNITYDNSSVSVLKFNTFVPVPVFTKTIIFENTNFTN